MPNSGTLLIAAALVVAGAAPAWIVQGWRGDAKLASEVAKTAKEGKTRADDYARQLTDAVAARDALARYVAGVDKQWTAYKGKAQNEIDRLNACVRDGTCGLRVNAECPEPTPGGIVPGPGAGRGLDTGTAPRLTALAERDYYALRRGLADQHAQLGACVEALGRITGQSPK